MWWRKQQRRNRKGKYGALSSEPCWWLVETCRRQRSETARRRKNQSASEQQDSGMEGGTEVGREGHVTGFPSLISRLIDRPFCEGNMVPDSSVCRDTIRTFSWTSSPFLPTSSPFSSSPPLSPPPSPPYPLPFFLFLFPLPFSNCSSSPPCRFLVPTLHLPSHPSLPPSPPLLSPPPPLPSSYTPHPFPTHPPSSSSPSPTPSAPHLLVSPASTSLYTTSSHSALCSPAAGLGASPGAAGGFHGDGAAQLPGQRPRGPGYRPEEVHPVLDLGAVLHHARRRPPQPRPCREDARGWWVASCQLLKLPAGRIYLLFMQISWEDEEGALMTAAGLEAPNWDVPLEMISLRKVKLPQMFCQWTVLPSISLFFCTSYPGKHIFASKMLQTGCLISCWSSFSNSPRSCGSPELHRDPGHITQGQLERTQREERRPHRYHVWLLGSSTGQLVHRWEIKMKASLDEPSAINWASSSLQSDKGRLSSGRLSYWCLNAAWQSSPRPHR